MESDACYVSTDKTGRFLFAAYLFPGMVTVHPIDTDGAARGPAVDTQAHRPLRPLHHHRQLQPVRLRSPRHSHGRHLSLSIRRNLRQTDALRSTQARHPDRTRPTPPCIPSHPGTSCTQTQSRPPASTSTVSDPADGSLEPIQSLSTLPDEGVRRRQQHRHPPGPPFREELFTSPIAATTASLHSTSTRSTGLLSPTGHSPTKECPRAFDVDPDGRFLYAGSDHSGRVTSHKIDSTGLLHSLDVYELGMWPSWVLPVKLP